MITPHTTRWPGAFQAAILALVFCTGSVQPSERVSDWPVSTRSFDRQRIAALDQAIQDDVFHEINSVVVARDGELLIERYYNGADRDTLHDPRSVSKTFTATILGIAIAGGYLGSVDQNLGEFYDLTSYPNFSPQKEAVTLRQLITMSSGFDGFDFDADSPGNEENMYPQPDWVKWTLGLPMAADRNPGDEWRYFTAGIVVLGDILNRHVPGGLESYAHDRLFGRLGITDYEWQHTPQKVGNTAGGLQLTPRDFAKFGELYRSGGTWQGERIVPEAWVEESLTPWFDTTVPGNRYGWLWWLKDYPVGDETWSTAYCGGNGGNKIFVFDQQGLVIVITASAYGKPYMHSQVDKMMEEYILPAVAAGFD
ncbi:serine hydrolase domain-containing protein [Pseudomonadota bacterium]